MDYITKGSFLNYLGLTLMICSYLSLFVLGFLDNARGPLYPQILQDLNLNSSYGSLVFVIPSTFSFIGSYISQFFVDKTASVAGVFLGSFLMASSYYVFSQSNELFVIALCLSFFGFGIGVTSVFEHVSIQKAASEKSRRKWLSGLHSVYAFASLAAPFLIQQGLADGLGWRDFFKNFSMLSSVIVIVLFVITVILYKKDIAMPLKGRKVDTASMISFKPIALICVIVSFYVIAEISIATRITQLLTSDYNFTLLKAANYVTYFFLLLFLGRIFFTFISFAKWGAEKLLFVSHFISICFFVLGIFYNPWFLVLCGLSMAPCYALNMDYIASVYQTKATKVMAQAMSMTSLIVMVSHYFIGVLTDMYSVRTALMFPLALLVICLICLVVFHKNYSKVV